MNELVKNFASKKLGAFSASVYAVLQTNAPPETKCYVIAGVAIAFFASAAWQDRAVKAAQIAASAAAGVQKGMSDAKG